MKLNKLTKKLILLLIPANFAAFADETKYSESNKAFVGSNSLTVNFVLGTAFAAEVGTKWGTSNLKYVGTSVNFPMIVNEEVCISVVVDPIITATRYDYYFKMNEDLPSEINFWGVALNPQFNYTKSSISEVSSETTYYSYPCSRLFK